MDRVHPDSAGAQLQCGRLGQPAHREFGCGVTVAGDGAGHALDRGDVDDRAAARFLHRFDHGADAQKHSGQVDVEDPLPFRKRVVLQGADVDDAGVVDQHIDPAELGQGGGHRRVPILGLGDVEMQVAGRLPTSAATALPSSSRMSPKTTLAPSATSDRTCDAPMPRAPPLTRATFPANRSATAFLPSSRCPDRHV